MKNPIKNWKPLKMTFNKEINDALQQQHHAAQYIALVGRHLIPQQADDSNTNMEFFSKDNLLIGNEIHNGLRVALQLDALKLIIFDKEEQALVYISLNGKTKQQVFDELKQKLSDAGIDVSNFNNELHYEIPSHPLDNGAVFSVKNEEDFIENSNYRHNAKIVLNEIGQKLKQKEPIRIWPHHFDTGAFYVFGKNDNNETSQTIGIGFAIPDSMINEPYYYLSFWSEKPLKGLDKLPALNAGKWMVPDWNGAVLKHSDILKADAANKQHELVKDFFIIGIDFLNGLFKDNS